MLIDGTDALPFCRIGGTVGPEVSDGIGTDPLASKVPEIDTPGFDEIGKMPPGTWHGVSSATTKPGVDVDLLVLTPVFLLSP
jgi:hypothetical protein